MSRRKRFWWWVCGSAIVLMLALSIAGVEIVSSAWFSNYVKQKIVSITEEATGGRAELGTFAFDWRHLRARVTGFVLHGKEKAPDAPLLRIEAIELQLRLVPSLRRTIDLEYLGLDRPVANIIVLPDGTTNIPEPKAPSKSNESALQEIVDLAIHEFELTGGSVQFAEQKIPLRARGRELRAQLFFNAATSIYRGNVSLSTEVAEQGRPPVEMSIKIPVTIGKNSLGVENASITTAESALGFSGLLTNPPHPVVEAHVVAHVSLSEVHRATGLAAGACVNCFADADVQGRVDEQKAMLQTAAIRLGRSRLDASGDRESVHVTATLAMDELARIFEFAGGSIGDVEMEGQVKPQNDRIYVSDMRIRGLGAELTIDGSLANYDRFEVKGRLGGLQIADLERRFLNAKAGYEGTIAGGVDASGSIKQPSSVRANARLNIVPGRRGIPVKGHVAADFDGSSNVVKIQSAALSLPHSSLTLRGVLGRSVDAVFNTTDTGDLYPAMAMAMKSPPHEVPLTLNGGTFRLQARADGPVASPSITAHVDASRFAWEKRAFDRFSADVTVSARAAAIQNGSLSRGTLQGTFSGSTGLRNWAIANDQPIQANAQMRNADVRDLLALAEEPTIPAAGKLNASLVVNGTVGKPIGNVSVAATDGNVYGEAFQSLDLQAELTDRLVRLTRGDWIGPAGTIQVNGTYSHARDTMLVGDLRMQGASNQVRIGAVSNAIQRHPGIDGTVQLTLAGEATIREERGETEFLPTAIRGEVRADNLHDPAKNYGSVSAHAETSGSTLSFRADSNLSGSAIHVTGRTLLVKEYPTSADVSIQNLVLQNLPFDLGIPIKGTAAINAHADGTLQNLVATAKLSLTAGEIEGEPVDRLDASASYSAQRIELSSLEAVAPAGSVSLNGSFTHPAGQYESGSFKAHVFTGNLRLDRIHTIQSAKPGLSGAAMIAADVAGDLRTVKGAREVVPALLDATVAATGLTYAGHLAGDAKLTAKTTNGMVSFAFDSGLAHSAIHGQGEVKLTADYPITAQFSAREIRLSNLRPFLNMETLAPDFDGSTEIEGSISGSARAWDQIRGEIRIPRLEASARTRGKQGQASIAFQNDGPIVAELDRSELNIRSAHIKGARGSDVVMTGTAGLTEQKPLRLTIKAHADLAMVEDIDRDFYSSGAVTMDVSLRGSWSDPLASGSIELKNASVNMTGVSNGISNANGTIALSGTRANIQNLTAESGGGKVTVSGYAAYSGEVFRYSVRANATRVRTRQQGISIVNNASLTLSGSGEKGLISGTVTVTSLGINPQSDIGAMLASAAAPPNNTEASSTLLSNTRLDIRVRTAPDVRFESTFAENLQAEADLSLIGTLALPGMTGRITITEGDLVFFGNQYTINRGVISFYNRLRIEPQLNVNLETNVKSVDVVVTLTGPIDNLKLSYRSDPPLQFEEIVALLATGRRPSSDPTIVATQAAPPQQSVGQMGESAIVSQAVASPVSSRMERVFGITALKIDPTFQSGSDLPTAALTLQQRVASNITFTYTQDYSQANSELVRVEWAISPRFSAVALRDINGIFGIDFFYKRQFR